VDLGIRSAGAESSGTLDPAVRYTAGKGQAMSAAPRLARAVLLTLLVITTVDAQSPRPTELPPVDSKAFPLALMDRVEV
jgi:hypothetical protein